MASNNNDQQCRHVNEKLIVCIYPGCQAEDLAACRKCMLIGHQHGLYAIHSLAIRDKISEFMSVIRRKEALEQQVAEHFEEQRRLLLDKLNRE